MIEEQLLPKKEANDRLSAISELINDFFNEDPNVLTHTYRLLENVQQIALGTDYLPGMVPKPELEHVVLSCDASIKQNPGGPSAIGAVIEVPGKRPMQIARRSKAETNNQAEYDAIYFAVVTLINLNNNPHCKIEIRSDSKLVIDQLLGEMKCNDEKLLAKKEGILRLTQELPVPVEFRWMPRNSTPQLKRANFLAQDVLGVPRH